MTDWELIRQHLAGDRAAMETLIRRHIDTVYTVARRSSRCSDADADDITQTVFLLLTRKAPHLPHRGTLVGWLYRATRWCAANLHKHNRRHQRLLEEAAMNTPHVIPITPENADWLEPLHNALHRLKPPERDAILLRYISQKSYDETAELLGMTPEAARKRTDRGLDKLRTLLLSHGHSLPAATAFATLLDASATKAPAATLHSALTIAAGTLPAPHIAALAQKAHALSTPLKVLLASSLTLAALITTLAVISHASPSNPVAPIPAPIVAAIPVSTPAASQPPLPEVTLNPADPDHPTPAEVKIFLQARLDRLSNLFIDYTVHTDYLPPAGGWPKFPPRPADALPPNMVLAAPAFYVQFAAAQTHYSTIYVFPSGSSDCEKSFSRLNTSFRYDRKLLHYTPAVPFPESVHEFQTQSATYTDTTIEQLFDDHLTTTSASAQSLPSFPTPDIEPALFLTYYIPTTGRAPRRAQLRSHIIAQEDFDAMTVSFPDTHHVVIERGRTLTLPIRNLPTSSTAPATRLTSRPFSFAEQWTLDRDNHYAPIAYYSSNNGLHMAMSDFHLLSGLMIPSKVTSTFTWNRVDEPAKTWRTDTLTVTTCRIQDPANTPDRYSLAPADAEPPPTPTRRAQPLDNIEISIGAESVDQNSLTRLNASFLNRKAPLASPSTPACRDLPAFFDAHDRFLAHAKQGNIDTLLIGDGLAAHWSDDPALWQKIGDPARTANFSLDGDTVENILWRINHGELDHLSPKTILLFVGNSDASNYGFGGPSKNSARPGTASVSFNMGGIHISWQPREDPPEDIADGISLLAKTIHEKCPTSRLLLLSLPPRPLITNASRGGFRSAPSPLGTNPDAPTLNDRIPQINALISSLPDTTFIDLTPATLNPDGTLSPTLYQRTGPTPALYIRWTNTLLQSIK